LTVFTILFLSENFLVDRNHLQYQLTEHLSKFDFIKERRNILVPRWLTRNLITHLKFESPKFVNRLTDPVLLRGILPTLFTMLYFVIWKFRIKLRSIEAILIVMVSFSPLILLMAAWDTERIWTYTIINTFICMWIFSQTNSYTGNTRFSWFTLTGILVLVFNIFFRIPLMDNLVERYTVLTRLIIYAPHLIGTTLLLALPWLLRPAKKMTLT